MKKTSFKCLKYIIIFGILAVFTYAFIKVFPIVKEGYNMYYVAVNEESIQTKLDKLKEDDTYITFDKIPEEFKKQILHSEDKRFYYHMGIDPIAIARATVHNIQVGSFQQGGSTITQQLAKNLYFSFEKKLERKVAELFVAFQLETLLSKDEILELYCNVVYFGEGCYGLEEAAEHYYNTQPNSLSEDQIAMLVYTIKSPNYFNPNVCEKIAA